MKTPLTLLAAVSLALSAGCLVNNGNDAGTGLDSGVFVPVPVLDGGGGANPPALTTSLAGSLRFTPQSAVIAFNDDGDGGPSPDLVHIFVSDQPQATNCDALFGSTAPKTFQNAEFILAQDSSSGGALAASSTARFNGAAFPAAGFSALLEYFDDVDGGTRVDALAADGGLSLSSIVFPQHMIGPYWRGGSATFTFDGVLLDRNASEGTLSGSVSATGCDYATLRDD